jgi:TRAP-type C4-dicarboxylate transport system permease large subunit
MFSILLAVVSGSFTRTDFMDALLSAARTSCMIAFILLGAAFLAVAMGFTGLPRNLASWIGEMGLSPYAMLAVLTVFFIVLGLFLDGISVVVLTTSIIMPMVLAVGIDPIWFGIYLVLVVEMSQITPPVGFNLFVIQGLTGIDILRIAKAALPFFFLLLLAVVLIILFPQIVTFLPNLMNR